MPYHQHPFSRSIYLSISALLTQTLWTLAALGIVRGAWPLGDNNHDNGGGGIGGGDGGSVGARSGGGGGGGGCGGTGSGSGSGGGVPLSGLSHSNITSNTTTTACSEHLTVVSFLTALTGLWEEDQVQHPLTKIQDCERKLWALRLWWYHCESYEKDGNGNHNHFNDDGNNGHEKESCTTAQTAEVAMKAKALGDEDSAKGLWAADATTGDPPLHRNYIYPPLPPPLNPTLTSSGLLLPPTLTPILITPILITPPLTNSPSACCFFPSIGSPPGTDELVALGLVRAQAQLARDSMPTRRVLQTAVVLREMVWEVRALLVAAAQVCQ